LLSQGIMNGVQETGTKPLVKIISNGAFGRKVVGKITPATAIDQQIKNGIPLLSKHHEETGIYDTDDAQTERLIQQVQWEVTKLVPGPVALSEFDVAQFLQPAWLFATKIAAVVIAIALICLGIYMKIRRS